MPPSGVGVWGALTVVVHAQLIIPHASHYMANDTTRWKPRPDITAFRTVSNWALSWMSARQINTFQHLCEGAGSASLMPQENFDIVSRLGSLLS